MKKLEHAPLMNLTFACELCTVAQFDPSFCANVAAAGGAHRGGRCVQRVARRRGRVMVFDGSSDLHCTRCLEAEGRDVIVT